MFTILIGYAPRPLLMRLFSLAAATLVTWRLNRALTFDHSGRRQHDEAMRYATVTAVAQGTSYAVFAALVLTVLGALPQAALVVGAVVGAFVAYNGHRLFAFAPRASPMSTHADVFVIGAGPPGLTAAYCLTKENPSVIVIEKDPVYVGGISRTVEYNGFMFDIGGHRFFSKAKEVVDLWKEILPDDFIERPRLSRIYYGGKYYSYPLSAFEALRESRPVHQRRLHAVVRLRQGISDQGCGQFPRMGAQPVRREAVLDLLQDLHRESVGHVVRRNLRRLGRAAHQGARSRRRGDECAEEGAACRSGSGRASRRPAGRWSRR